MDRHPGACPCLCLRCSSANCMSCIVRVRLSSNSERRLLNSPMASSADGGGALKALGAAAAAVHAAVAEPTSWPLLLASAADCFTTPFALWMNLPKPTT